MTEYHRVMFEKSGEAIMEIENGRVTRFLTPKGDLMFKDSPMGEGYYITEKYIKFEPTPIEADPVDPKDPPKDERTALLEARLAELVAMLQRTLDERYDSARTVIEMMSRLSEIRTELGM